MKFLVFLAIMMVFHAAHGRLCRGGGDNCGNGGQTVVCRNTQGQITSIEVLDSYEGRQFYQMKLDLGSAKLNYEQKADLAIQRLAARNPTRSALFSKWRKNFFDGVTFVDQPLPATEDVDPSIFPKGCQIEQIAIQKDTRSDRATFDHGPTVTINRPLWNHLNADQKAILVLHEIIYHEADLWTWSASAKPIRYFNQLLISNRVQNLNEDEYLALLVKLGYKEWDYRGLRVYTRKYSYGSEKYILIADQEYNYKGTILHLEADTAVDFRHTGDLYQAVLKGPNLVPTKIGKLNLTSKITFYDDSIWGYLYEDTVLDSQNGYQVPCAKDSKIHVSEQGLTSCSGMTVGKNFKGPDFDFKLLKPLPFYWDKGQYAFPDCNGASALSGSWKFNGSDLEVSSFKCGEFKSLIAALAKPASMTILDTKMDIIGHLEIDKFFEKVYIRRFQPVENFSVFKYDVEYPVASKTKCSKNKTMYHFVELDSDGGLHGFVLSKDWKIPDGPNRGTLVRQGTYVRTPRYQNTEIGAHVCSN